MKPIPDQVILEGKSNPMAVINFLQSKRTVATPLNPEELVDVKVNKNGATVTVKNRRGYGYDCNCFGTGWIFGRVLCGKHKPLIPLHYED